jgi:hypothetical protein
MKRFLILSIIAITLIACSKEDDFVPKAEISKQSLQFSQNGGVDSFAITSNTNWIIVEDADWISLSPQSGVSSEVVKVSVSANTLTTSRTAVITVKVEGLPDMKVDVSQSEALAPNAEVDKLSLQFSPNSSIDSFAITSNVNWTIEKDADWISLSKESGNSNELVKVTVTENTVATSRTAVITVKAEGLPDITIDVSQSKALKTTGLFILNEGTYGEGNSDISYYNIETKELSLFSQKNGKPIGDGVNDLAMYGSKLYCVVTGGTEGYIEVINPETGMSIKRVPVTNEDGTNGQPRRIIFHENKAYVTTYSQSVIRLDTASLNIDGTASLSGTFAEGICYYDSKLYVCNSGQGSGNTVSVVNLSSFTETETISVPQNPVMIEATATGDIYFTTSSLLGAGWVEVTPPNLHLLNPEQKQVTRTFDVRASKIALAKDFIYAIDFNWSDYSDQISKINLQTKAVTDITDIFEEYTMVYGISVNPLNDDIYLTNTGQDAVAFDKDGNEKFGVKTGLNYTMTVVPVIK